MGKSDRELRSNTRKDYAKMADVNSDSDSERCPNDNHHVREPGFMNQNNNKNIDDGGEIINNEFLLSEEESCSDIDGDHVESSDEDVKAAREQLERLKLKQKDVAKQNKLKKIAEETKAVRKSLDRIGSKGKRASGHVTVASLRKMDDVVDRVDKLMDEKLKFKRGDSYDSDSDEISKRDRGRFDSSDERRSRRRVEDEREVVTSHKSGKSKSITSNVKYPQEWPHSHLALHFVNKKKDYEELSIAEFCAGYSAILEFSSGEERKHRISHLKELMFLATRFTWRAILNYHGACLMEIERGHLCWGDSFLVLQSTTLAGSALLHSNPGSGRSANSFGGTNVGKSESVLFCNKYQRGICPQTRDHYGYFYGENRMLKHICAACWNKGKKLENHPETADECPYKQ